MRGKMTRKTRKNKIEKAIGADAFHKRGEKCSGKATGSFGTGRKAIGSFGATGCTLGSSLNNTVATTVTLMMASTELNK